jgi:phosphoribosylformylglycinamidine (FGAM) synthase-like enzyme/phosphoribosylformylglycinamidine (FGAM) synthase PurS component
MIYRIDVRTIPTAQDGGPAVDPAGQALVNQVSELGIRAGAIEVRRVFFIDTDMARADVESLALPLLADPVVELAEVFDFARVASDRSRIEVHLKPGVMDPVAASTEAALADLGLKVRQVRTGRAFIFDGPMDRDHLQTIASRILANGVIESVHFEPFLPRQFEAGHDVRFTLKHVSLRTLNDSQLAKLSRDGHLFLSLAEMKAAQKYFVDLNREPTDIELETLAQTWSEHCVHKTLKSAVDVEVRDESGKVVGHRKYQNLIKETIFQSTVDLMKQRESNPFCLSVFADNAGVIAFDETDAVCFKAETHNHPSAIEPYGGSATGVGGVIRDILGTGLGAKPIANTDVFCVAYPDRGTKPTIPKGVIHPKRVLQQVVAGVRDYGNRMGIPTVNGAVYFDDRYIGNPLVFCGCIGLIPRNKIAKKASSGDAIVVVGGATGRDGIHGATFSSAELTDTHADEFSHAVQIGNAITEKKVADVILQARDLNLFSGITDCGAGGLSSAIGEMGEKIGATVDLDKVPLKYSGLRYDEIWISEAQERMVLSVPMDRVDALLKLAGGEDVSATVIGTFGTEERELILNYRGTEVGRMSMHFLHDGIPMPTRKAIVVDQQTRQTRSDRGVAEIEMSIALELSRHFDGSAAGEFKVTVDRETSQVSASRNGIEVDPRTTTRVAAHVVKSTAMRLIDEGKSAPSSAPRASGIQTANFKQFLLSYLAHPNIASKHWIIRQYDHEVQGGSVIKPLIGPLQIGPSDAAVLRPKLSSYRGIAVGCGLVPGVTDPYAMAIAAIDEAIRNIICVGADYGRIAILDNFCWPSVDDETTMGALVRACEACRDAAIAFGIPFISGKDSLHNQFTNQETGEVTRIPNTLLISAMGIVEDVRKCITMDFKKPGNAVYLVSAKDPADLESLAATHQMMATWIAEGKIAAAHDVSDGGVAVAAAEMCIASGFGIQLQADIGFEERPGQYLVEALDGTMFEGSLRVGTVQLEPVLKSSSIEISLVELTKAWRGTLDW